MICNNSPLYMLSPKVLLFTLYQEYIQPVGLITNDVKLVHLKWYLSSSSKLLQQYIREYTSILQVTVKLLLFLPFHTPQKHETLKGQGDKPYFFKVRGRVSL